MHKIQTLNSISPVIYDSLTAENFTIVKEDAQPDAILVRSAKMHDMELPASLLSIARAGAGYNNIPVDKCTEKGIVVFNTPGANANAVKELVLAGMLMASRDIYGAMQWVQGLEDGSDVAALVEKGKSQFVGPELSGKTLAVLGLGAVGALVANLATHLGMTVIGYDPFISVESAWSLSRSVKRATSMDAMLADADYVTIHIPLSNKTRNMVDEAFLSKMKAGSVLLNFARGELVDSDALKAALASGQLRKYVVDFPCSELLRTPGVLSIPHLGASTPESEDNCADMAAQQTRDFLMTGTIRNSVNLPALELDVPEKHRIAVIHKNIPNMLGQITTQFAAVGVNIEHMVNRSRGEVAYTVLDADAPLSKEGIDKMEAVEGIIRVRVIC